jgi:hypothetical protein
MDDTSRAIITTLSNMKEQISRLNLDDNKQLLEIHNIIQRYLDEHPCQHNVLYDFIDMPPEGGKTIKFCDICWETFN